MKWLVLGGDDSSSIVSDAQGIFSSIFSAVQSTPGISSAAELAIDLLIIKSITGTDAQTAQGNGYTQIVLSADQQAKLRDYVDGLLSSSSSSGVMIDLNPIWIPVLIKHGWPFLLGAAVLGWILHR